MHRKHTTIHILSLKIKKTLKMKITWLMIWIGAVFSNPVTGECTITSQSVICEESAKNYSSIPTLSKNVTKLYLSNNSILLNRTDKKVLQLFINLTELYLNENAITVLYNNTFYKLSKLTILDISHNCINTIEQAAFAGLNQLSTLYLNHNKIFQMDSYIFTMLKNLMVLSLQGNLLEHLDIKAPFKPFRINLKRNPWNCSCGLLHLQKWLNLSYVKLEHENDTLCEYPNAWNKFSIKTAPIQKSDCDSGRGSLTKAALSKSTISPKTIVILTSSLDSSNNSIRSNASHPGSPPLGKTWAFLLGVVVFVLSTSLLILIAIKFPMWYRYLISYNHHRLEEQEPEMFEKEFTTDLGTPPSVLNISEQYPTVIFEQTHIFTLDEDGFIEDKYIDDPGLTEKV
ncbi:leucine-rich repeat-containing protein 19 [Pelodiscus sinensis]|uniref:leucine-rich repeat-containing protein 19 n=1 Tax=Pelodiscus sinensis TaxID=13735 RepID=UPI0003C4A752|nr:leucine-rich repeat-containing protein 19 [Pelodiscus sinensis]|eukprot:XP_006127305.1 leucine-rich repeat-containing protein 19 [Pelodiscus sinensis]